MRKLRSPACCRLENAIFLPHIHQTWPEPFSGALYAAVEERGKERGIDGDGSRFVLRTIKQTAVGLEEEEEEERDEMEGGRHS